MASLPSYEKPPVVEVVLGVQFAGIQGLGVAQLGLLWQRFRDDLPVTQDHPPLPRATEEFGVRPVPGVRFEAEVLTGPMAPRVWFLNRHGSELVQVQRDRLVVNWRKTSEDDAYPRYDTVRQKFDAALNTFRGFLADHSLGELQPDLCEVTYINHFAAGAGWERHGDVAAVASIWSGVHSDSFLPEPEEVRFATQYVIEEMDEIRGRLHVVLEPAYRIAENQAILVMNLTARGQPVGEGLEGVGRFLDIGHEWIVRGFTSVTAGQMHGIWRRRNGG